MRFIKWWNRTFSFSIGQALLMLVAVVVIWAITVAMLVIGWGW